MTILLVLTLIVSILSELTELTLPVTEKPICPTEVEVHVTDNVLLILVPVPESPVPLSPKEQLEVAP